jgi:hypothetical protein
MATRKPTTSEMCDNPDTKNKDCLLKEDIEILLYDSLSVEAPLRW